MLLAVFNDRFQPCPLRMRLQPLGALLHGCQCRVLLQGLTHCKSLVHICQNNFPLHPIFFDAEHVHYCLRSTDVVAVTLTNHTTILTHHTFCKTAVSQSKS